MSLRITLLGVNEVREFGWISQKEDWSVIGNNIPIAFISPHLHGEASRVAGEIVRAGLATDRGETHGKWTFFALGAVDVG